MRIKRKAGLTPAFSSLLHYLSIHKNECGAARKTLQTDYDK